jgi:serine O-acetyltransferase
MMKKEFIERLYTKHLQAESFPPTSSVYKLITKILLTLFPEQARKHFKSSEDLYAAFDAFETELYTILATMQNHLPAHAGDLAASFMDSLPGVYDDLNTDLEAIVKGDPAAKSEYEVIRAYPGFYSMAFYRMAHVLHNLNIPLLPRALTEYAHSKTGIDIHPGAKLGTYLFIDHGTGITIGETAVIGKHVKLYQGVTLGALSVDKDMANKKRHPTIEDHVVIYSGATILGGDTIIGHHCVVGGNVWLTNSLPPHTKIYHQEQVKIKSE